MAKTKWVIDPSHSEITFKVKHLMISTVTGTFRKFSGALETEGNDFNTLSDLVFTADIDSIDTNNEQRDGHLKSPEFFHAGEYPQLKFAGSKYEDKGDEATLQGDLILRGVTKPVTLHVEFGGIVTDPYGQTKAGFTVTGKISRKEFGLIWNAVTDAGSVVLGDEIRINAEVQVIKQA
jgi:polyisoprenoid-binding protein YceI